MTFDAADILSAVIRERERCAKIAEAAAAQGAGEIYIARQIADSIRVVPQEGDEIDDCT